jgi:lipopolysaccharide biosynthesis protein
MSLLAQLTANHGRSPYYRDEEEFPRLTASPVRLIAYYLPQFHSIPENDTWWGRGFTEWTNVTKALPRFKGHYQPHLPGELGFYDLRQTRILKRQAELVRGYGLEGLCFHHYWFGGKTLLDTPIRLLLKHPEIDLPFCINWANENWSRRWDGSDEEVLIGQAHSSADDIAFAVSLEPLFRDPRYIRINGRPLLMVYRPKILPNARETVGRWRAHFQAIGLGDPYIVMAQVYGDADPRSYGMDAAAGFPPHNTGIDDVNIRDALIHLDPDYGGQVVDYADLSAGAIANRPSAFRLFPGVCPSWDNEARRPGKGLTFVGASPAAYHSWLTAACESTFAVPDASERIVFINAWNEWAEGAHLEPDRHLGYAYLVETARVMAKLSGLSVGAWEPIIPPSVRGARRRGCPLSMLPKMLVKNLAFQGAKMAEAIARRLRKLVRNLN